MEQIEINIESREKYSQIKDKTFVIGSVRNATPEVVEKFEDFVNYLETREEPVIVHLPHRDTVQTNTGLQICTQNEAAIADPEAPVIVIFYDETSQGSHFDIGATLANGKEVFVAEYISEGGWFADLLREWEEKGLPAELDEEDVTVDEDMVFLIADVDENTPQKEVSRIQSYVDRLEKNGLKVYWPYIHGPKDATKLEEALEYRKAMKMAGRVHTFYTPTNKTFFFLGLGFGCKKPLTVVKNVEYGPGKSYPRMIDEWEEATRV
jgi:hypothetical protein